MADKTGFCVEIRFLSRGFAATAHDDWRRAEWPPHPARLFSAMVNEWALAGKSQRERAALEWMETLPPPDIYDPGRDVRSDYVVYVPENRFETVGTQQYANLMGGKEGISGLAIRGPAETRSKKPRTMPSSSPNEETAAFIWREGADADTLESIDAILSRVSRLGRSSSLVACIAADADAYTPNLIWDDANGDERNPLRWVTGAGQLEWLERLHETHANSGRSRRLPYRNARYRRAGEIKPATTADFAPDRWVVFEFDEGSRSFPVSESALIARAMRRAVLHYAENPIPPAISGHEPSGNRIRSGHVGFHALPYVGGRYADGRIIGVALSIPPDIADDARRKAYRAVGLWQESANGGPLALRLNRSTEIRMRYVAGESGVRALNAGAWARPSKRWASATPVAMLKNCFKVNRNGRTNGKIKEEKAADSIADACELSGYPRPKRVEFDFAPFLTGAAHAREYPAFRQGRLRRMLLHALVEFDAPVSGPMALGAGRYMGMGLMKPIGDGHGA